MKVYTIYKVIKYQTKQGETKQDLQIVKQTENRENAAKWLEINVKHINRIISNDIDNLKLSNNGLCCFTDIIDD